MEIEQSELKIVLAGLEQIQEDVRSWPDDYDFTLEEVDNLIIAVEAEQEKYNTQFKALDTLMRR